MYTLGSQMCPKNKAVCALISKPIPLHEMLCLLTPPFIPGSAACLHTFLSTCSRVIPCYGALARSGVMNQFGTRRKNSQRAPGGQVSCPQSSCLSQLLLSCGAKTGNILFSIHAPFRSSSEGLQHTFPSNNVMMASSYENAPHPGATHSLSAFYIVLMTAL